MLRGRLREGRSSGTIVTAVIQDALKSEVECTGIKDEWLVAAHVTQGHEILCVLTGFRVFRCLSLSKAARFVIGLLCVLSY